MESGPSTERLRTRLVPCTRHASGCMGLIKWVPVHSCPIIQSGTPNLCRYAPGLYIHPLYLFHFRSVTVFRFVTYIKWEVQVCLSRADYYSQHRRRIFHKGQKRHKFLRVPGKTFVYLKDIILSKKRIPKELSGNCRSPRDYIYIVTRRWTSRYFQIS